MGIPLWECRIALVPRYNLSTPFFHLLTYSLEIGLWLVPEGKQRVCDLEDLTSSCSLTLLGEVPRVPVPLQPRLSSKCNQTNRGAASQPDQPCGCFFFPGDLVAKCLPLGHGSPALLLTYALSGSNFRLEGAWGIFLLTAIHKEAIEHL